jgi:hypothetical protein
MSLISKFYVITERFAASTFPVAVAAALGFSMVLVVEIVNLKRTGGEAIFSSRAMDKQRLFDVEKKVEILQSNLYVEGAPVKPVDSARVLAVEQKQKAIEAALNKNIETALSIAMIRRDLDELKEGNVKRFDSLDSRIESTFQLLLWLLGVLITVLIAALGWIVANRATRTNEK